MFNLEVENRALSSGLLSRKSEAIEPQRILVPREHETYFCGEP